MTTPIDLSALGPYALAAAMLAAMFTLLTTGRLVTLRQHEAIVSILNDRVTKLLQLYEEERGARSALQEVVNEQSEQIGTLVESVGIVEDFFNRVPVKEVTKVDS